MDVGAFVDIQKRCIRAEYQAEVDAADLARRTRSVAALQRAGRALSGLYGYVEEGIFGRSRVILRSTSIEAAAASKFPKSLPANKFSVGSIARLSRVGERETTKEGDGAVKITGVVSRRTQSAIHLSVDERLADALQDIMRRRCETKGGRFRIDLIPDMETRKRLERCLDVLTSPPPSCASVAPLFRQTDFDASTPIPSSESVEFFDKSLNASQRRAVRMCLDTSDVAFVHGPPGTGKTTTLVEFVRQCALRGRRVLVCAPSNVAVDNFAARLGKYAATSVSPRRKAASSARAQPIRMVRLGHPARVQNDVLEHTLEARISSSQEAAVVKTARADVDRLRTRLWNAKRGKFRGNERKGRRRENDDGEVDTRATSVRELREELRELRKDIRRRERVLTRSIVANAHVVLCTNTGAARLDWYHRELDDENDTQGGGRIGRGARKIRSDVYFDVCVVDEAAQSLEAACWIPMSKSKVSILGGDHKQLPPTITSKDPFVVKTLRRTLFERGIRMKGSRSTLLNVQYRMNRAISSFASAEMYDGKLVAHESVADRTLDELVSTSSRRSVLTFVDTSGFDDFEEVSDDGGSKFNLGEARLCAEYVVSLLCDGLRPANICVITPYNAQVAHIRSRLREAESEDAKLVEVRSVDGFQGQERDVVVLSLVRSNAKGQVGFLRERRRLNVALTRAKRHVAIFADSTTVSRDAFILKLLQHVEARGTVFDVRTFELSGLATDASTKLLDATMPASGRHDDDTKRHDTIRKRVREFHREILATTDDVQKYRKFLRFPRSLSKEDRAVVHEEVEALGDGARRSESSGQGAFRRVMVTAARRKSPEPLNDDDDDDSGKGGDDDRASYDKNVPRDQGVSIAAAQLTTSGRVVAKECVTEVTPSATFDSERAPPSVSKATSSDTVGVDEKVFGDDAPSLEPIGVKFLFKGKTYKVSIACSRRTTFGDFRALVENVVSIPKDEQKIIFKGKKRTDKDETMFSAGVKNGSRLMVMHVPKASAATRSAASFASTSKRSASARSRARRKLREGGARGSTTDICAAEVSLTKKVCPRARSNRKSSTAEGNKTASTTHAAADGDDDDSVLRETRRDRCAYPSCTSKTVALYGLSCSACRRTFCQKHLVPEVHGCDALASRHAREDARKASRRLRATGTAEAPKPLPEWKRKALRRQLKKRIAAEEGNRRRNARSAGGKKKSE